MKVLILGATGFIGLPAAQAFVRNGHEVYGQTRSASKARLLASEEIIPVIADPATGEQWSAAAEQADVVIDCTGGTDIQPLSQYVFDVACAAARTARGASAPRLTYIYCSGSWVHGDDRTHTTSERSPPKNTTPLVAWRPAHEQRVLASPAVDGIVLRPALLYGRGGSILASLFAAARTAAAQGKDFAWPGRPGGRWALVHVDDLARLFLCVAEAAPACKGLVFDAANDHSEPVSAVLDAAAGAAGARGWAYREPASPFEEAVATTTLLRPSLARALVGWRPLKAGLVDGMPAYYAAYAASVRAD
ncbi:NAD-binding protein [Phellopilus nigrolimitatus]|nr:NAD-binding protein [Phellopilus nigrolimitatus]